jgi:hypothetical protein
MSLVALDRREEAAGALARYLAMEHRPEQRQFVVRARHELARLGGTEPATTPGAGARGLIERVLDRIDEAARAAGRVLAPRAGDRL